MKVKNGVGSRKRRNRQIILPIGITAVLLVVGLHLNYPSTDPLNDDLTKRKAKKIEEDQLWQNLFIGKLTLVGLDFESTGYNILDHKIPYALFCHLENWSHHHQAPQEVPMFRYLQEESKYCKQTMLRVPVQTAVQALRKYDASLPNGNKIKLLDFKGAIFHETRVGSTLLANMLASLPDVRVYSESRPPIMALNYACQQAACTRDLLMDVLYFMRRVSKDSPEQYLFWKFQSAATWQLEAFVQALPETPWIFVYRDPVQVMVSHFQDAHKGPPKCAQRQKRRPQPIVVTMLERYFGRSSGRGGPYSLARAVSVEQYCAAHLASLTNAAVSVLQQQTVPSGRAVNYDLLPDLLWNDLLPNHFQYNVSAGEIARMQEQALVYSKGATGKTSKLDKIGIFQSDSQRKEQAATSAIKAAAQRALQESYEQLEALSR